MNNLNIHKVTEVLIKRKAHLSNDEGNEFHTLTIEVYDKDHNTFEIMLYGKKRIDLEVIQEEEQEERK